MAKTEQTPKKAKNLADKADTPLSKKSKPQMKAGPPKKKVIQKADHAARMAIASGEVIKDEVARKTEQDARTLYIRFAQKLPTDADQIKELHSDIKFVRTPRSGTKKDVGINYAFLEFGDAEECTAAKNKLSTTQFKGNELYVDFVGENSKAKKKTGASKQKGELNPTRLFVVGLAPGVNKSNLKEMFPKASQADIPQKSKKKGTSYGFVQFSTPSDAKAAFDAAQSLEINGHRITVLFAKKTETKPEVQKKKAEKRKAKEEEKKLKRLDAGDVKDSETTPDVQNKKAEKRKAQDEKKNLKKLKTDVKEVIDEEVKDEDDDKEDEDDDKENEDEADDDDEDDDDEADEEEMDDTIPEKKEEDGDDEDDEEDDDDDEEEEDAVEDVGAVEEDDDDDDDDDEDDDDDDDDE
eukprot:GFUD01118439.1.p1 GENE.GFUD01118439.1~~GFUD01118439.1.p1  ORF type:complete len:409 (-),score=191.62 GFUD01118439.1:93-1319(-)